MCVCAWVCLWRPEEGVDSPGAGILGGCEQLIGVLGTNLDPLEEQSELLVIVASLLSWLCYLLIVNLGKFYSPRTGVFVPESWTFCSSVLWVVKRGDVCKMTDMGHNQRLIEHLPSPVVVTAKNCMFEEYLMTGNK